MKKTFLIIFLIAFLVLSMVSTGYCSENRWGQTDTYRLLKKVMPGYLQAAGTAFGGSTSMTSSQTAVSTSYSVVLKAIVSDTNDPGATVAGTLVNGTKGQVLKIYISAVGTCGDTTGSWILTPTTKTGFTTLTFDAQADEVTLLYVDSTIGWILLGSTSVTIGYPF